MSTQDLIPERREFDSPTFSLGNRVRRVLWRLSWFLLARWTPPPVRRWRIAILRLFGAQVSWRASIYPDVKIWAPWNLHVDDFGTLGPGVTVYNIAKISIGYKSIVSQGAHLCTGTHDYRDPAFPLFAKPINIGRRAWVCADSFIGPGVTLGEGAVLAATASAFKSLDEWTVYIGNPAQKYGSRPAMDD